MLHPYATRTLRNHPRIKAITFQILTERTDKVTRVSAINDDVSGGLKMIDLESMNQSLGLAYR